MRIKANRQVVVHVDGEPVVVQQGADIYESIDQDEWEIQSSTAMRTAGAASRAHQGGQAGRRATTAPRAERAHAHPEPAGSGTCKAFEATHEGDGAVEPPTTVQTIFMPRGREPQRRLQPRVPPRARPPARPPACSLSRRARADHCLIDVARNRLRFVDNGRGLTPDELLGWSSLGQSNHSAESQGAADGGFFARTGRASAWGRRPR